MSTSAKTETILVCAVVENLRNNLANSLTSICPLLSSSMDLNASLASIKNGFSPQCIGLTWRSTKILPNKNRPLTQAIIPPQTLWMMTRPLILIRKMRATEVQITSGGQLENGNNFSLCCGWKSSKQFSKLTDIYLSAVVFVDGFERVSCIN